MKELLAGQLDLAFLTALDLISLDSDTLRWKAVENYHMCIYLSQYHPLYHTDAAALSISQFKTDYFVAIQESTLLNCNTETEKNMPELRIPSPDQNICGKYILRPPAGTVRQLCSDGAGFTDTVSLLPDQAIFYRRNAGH